MCSFVGYLYSIYNIVRQRTIFSQIQVFVTWEFYLSPSAESWLNRCFSASQVHVQTSVPLTKVSYREKSPLDLLGPNNWCRVHGYPSLDCQVFVESSASLGLSHQMYTIHCTSWLCCTTIYIRLEVCENKAYCPEQLAVRGFDRRAERMYSANVWCPGLAGCVDSRGWYTVDHDCCGLAL